MVLVTADGKQRSPLLDVPGPQNLEILEIPSWITQQTLGLDVSFLLCLMWSSRNH